MINTAYYVAISGLKVRGHIESGSISAADLEIDYLRTLLDRLEKEIADGRGSGTS